MADKYYLYINQDDLYRFLIENIIYPYDPKFEGRKSLSLKYYNCLFLTKKRFSRNEIINNCKDGLNFPIVLEVNINFDKTKVIRNDDQSILLNDVISFCCVSKIFKVEEDITTFIFRDLYLFNSLVDDNFFPFGDEKVNDDICINEYTSENLENTIYKWSKIQALYCARFGYLEDVELSGKKKIIFKRNIDLDSFKYISDDSYDEFIKKYYKLDKTDKQIPMFKCDTTFLNDHFEDLIKSIFNGANYDEEEQYKYQLLYKTLYEYNGEVSFESLINEKDTFKQEIDVLGNINKDQISNISYLKQAFNDCGNRLAISLFILNQILDLDIQKAKLYINNFTEHSEFEKELLSMYAFANGMKRINFELKAKPGILLFSFNRTKNYLNSFVDMNQSLYEYYSERDVEPEIIMKDGFNLKIYDEKKEIEYIKNKLNELLTKRFNYSQKFLNRITVNKFKPKELHGLFLRMKKEEDKTYGL